MGNRFGTVEDLNSDRLYLSNASTDVFFDVLTLAASPLANTPWQQNLALLFADGHRFSRGVSGFDLADLPWTVEEPQEHAFLKAVIASALTSHNWHLLSYAPPLITDQLRTYQHLVDSYVPTPNPASQYGDWTVPPPPAQLALCAKHPIYMGEAGCRLCDTSIQ
jgi:hypothetical protein